MNNQIKVGSDAYRAILARVNFLELECSRRLLTPQEYAEQKREKLKLEEAELAHAIPQGATE